MITLWMPNRFPFGTRILSGSHAKDWKVEPRKEKPKPKIDKRQYYVLYMEGYVE